MKIVKPIFESFKVRSNEVYVDGKTTMPAICNYLQEIAGDSAQQLGFSIEQLLSKNVTWVLTRLKVEMDLYPIWREKIEVETWPSGYDKMVATRDFRIWNSKKEVIGKASSVWMLIDLTSRRPVMVEPFLSEFARENEDRALIIKREDRLKEITQATNSKLFNVRYGDLDLNNHVNNVHFVEWVLESVQTETRDKLSLKSIDIQFKAECFYGDLIKSESELVNQNNVIHQLIRESDQKEVARAFTVWE